MSDILDDLLGDVAIDLGTDSEDAATEAPVAVQQNEVIVTGGRRVVNPTPLKSVLLRCIEPDKDGRRQVSRLADIAGMSGPAFHNAVRRERFSYHVLKKLVGNSRGEVEWSEVEYACI